jgi:hypothetical protein
MNTVRIEYIEHKGFWFDIGDEKSLLQCATFVSRNKDRIFNGKRKGG